MAEGECAEELLAELYRRGLLRIISPDKVWCHKGRPVTNALFAVPKPTSDEMKVRIAGVAPDADVGCSEQDFTGMFFDLQRLIMNLIPSNACQRRLGGDVGALPSSGQWDALHLMALEPSGQKETGSVTSMCIFFQRVGVEAWPSA